MIENQYPPTKPVCQLDTDNLYLHQTVADLDPLAADGSYLLPAGCIVAEPPEDRVGFAACWLPERAEWQYLPDHRGKTAYRMADGAAVQIEQVGEPPDELTFTPREKEHQTWDDKAKAWVLLPAVAAQIKAEQQDEMWERIKTKRTQSRHAGIYINSIEKWFHSDAESRMQYTFLRTLDKLPEKLLWKTLDNSFVPMTRELLDELSLKLISDEQHDFQNAEWHKAAMLKAANPLEYDYSNGWSAADLMDKETQHG